MKCLKSFYLLKKNIRLLDICNFSESPLNRINSDCYFTGLTARSLIFLREIHAARIEPVHRGRRSKEVDLDESHAWLHGSLIICNH